MRLIKLVLGSSLLLAGGVLASTGLFEQFNNNAEYHIGLSPLNEKAELLSADHLLQEAKFSNLQYNVGTSIRFDITDSINIDVAADFIFGKGHVKAEAPKCGACQQFIDSCNGNNNWHFDIDANVACGYKLFTNAIYQLLPYLKSSLRIVRTGEIDRFSWAALFGMRNNFMLNDKIILSPYVEVGTLLISKLELKKYKDFNKVQGNHAFTFGGGLEFAYRINRDLLLSTKLHYARLGCDTQESPNKWKMKSHGNYYGITVGIRCCGLFA